MKRISP